MKKNRIYQFLFDWYFKRGLKTGTSPKNLLLMYYIEFNTNEEGFKKIGIEPRRAIGKKFRKAPFIKTLKNNQFVHLTIEDYGVGVAEILSVDVKNAKATIKWVTFTPCYRTLFVNERIFQENSEICFEELYNNGEDITPISFTDDDALLMRESNIKWLKEYNYG